MNILLTNDDGIYAPGLESLYKRLASQHSVSIIAPDREQSAVGHAITLNKPLRVQKVSINNAFQGYAVSGTPADCIKMGILEILDSKPDMVISGINPGANIDPYQLCQLTNTHQAMIRRTQIATDSDFCRACLGLLPFSLVGKYANLISAC